MAELNLKVSVVAGKDLAQRFKHAGADARREIRREFNSAMYLLASLEKSKLASTFTRRTGLLENVIVEPSVEAAGGLEGKVGTVAPYARIHEFGGDIHAKNVAHLTIPLAAMKTGRGVARGTARDLIASPSSYGYDSTFFRSGIIFGKQGDSISPLFALKTSVRMPERPTWRPAIEEITPVFEAKMSSAFVRLFEKAA